MARDTQYNLGYVFKFGKYKGEPLWQILEDDTKYITWLIENMPGFYLDNEAFTIYLEELEK